MFALLAHAYYCRYHSAKMKEVNDRIARLWEETYQGQDIDLIQIKADEARAAQPPIPRPGLRSAHS